MTLPTAPHPPNVLRVRAPSPSPLQQRGNAKRMLHLRCGQDYLKNLLKPIRHYFLFSIIFLLVCTPSIVPRDLNEAMSVWSFLFVFNAEPDMSAESIFFCKKKRKIIYIIMTQVLFNHHHYDSIDLILHLD